MPVNHWNSNAGDLFSPPARLAYFMGISPPSGQAEVVTASLGAGGAAARCPAGAGAGTCTCGAVCASSATGNSADSPITTRDTICMFMEGSSLESGRSVGTRTF